MSAKQLYFDESGFSGYNLLDQATPVFVEASTDIGNEEASEILSTAFPRYNGNEFHFTNLWRNRRKTSIERFAETISAYSERIFVYAIDKKFCVLTKALDFLVEPIYHAAGHDWYANGYCARYANFAYWGVFHEGSEELYEAIVRAWQRFSRQPNQQTLADLQSTFRIMANSLPAGPDLIVKQLSTGADLFHHFSDIDSFSGSDELQVTTIVAIIAWWRQRFSEDFIVYHDNSSNFFRRMDIWRKIVGPDAPRATHHLADGTSVEFPLRVVDTHPLDSADNSAIQLCDVIAGLAAKIRSGSVNDADEKILDGILDAGFRNISFNGIFFRPEFPETEPEKLNGPDAVDKMSANIFR